MVKQNNSNYSTNYLGLPSIGLSFGLLIGIGKSALAMDFSSFLSMMIPNAFNTATKVVTNTITDYWEVEATHENIFNEAIEKRDRWKAERTVEEVFKRIRTDLIQKGCVTNEELKVKYYQDEIVKSYCKAYRNWYNRYQIAWLILDYVEACRKKYDETVENIKDLMPQKDNDIPGMSEKTISLQLQYFQGFLDKLNKLRENIGAMLYHRYRYERGGGGVERLTKSSGSKNLRNENWGVYSFSNASYTLMPDLLLDPISEHSKAEEIVYNSFCKAYIDTVGIISLHESAAMGFIELYKEKFYEDFPNSELTACKLSEHIFPRERITKEGLEEKNYLEEEVLEKNSPPFKHQHSRSIPINTVKRKSSSKNMVQSPPPLSTELSPIAENNEEENEKIFPFSEPYLNKKRTQPSPQEKEDNSEKST